MEHLDLFWSLLSRKLAGEASESELQELNALMEVWPELRDSARQAEAVWELPNKPDEEYLEATYLMMRDRLLQNEQSSHIAELETTVEPRRRRPAFLKAVPALLIVSVLMLTAGLVWYTQVGKQSSNLANANPQPVKEVVTNKATKTKLVLPDGTIAWLNAGSKLTYGNWTNANTREVSLMGEGYFDVAKNPQKPFIIHTSVLDVRVLGTRFNLKAYPEEPTTETSLLHGSVEVRLHQQPNKVIRLVPNQKLIVRNIPEMPQATQPKKSLPNFSSEILPLKAVQIGGEASLLVETSWVSNKLAFVDEAFADVARKMERWYDVRIEFNNPRLEELRLTGSFENESLTQAIEALRFIADFKYKIVNDTITIY
ncbi:MAG: DUF4974 domain-containing protein [Chitinophagales bacterium]|jgi:ferric-dicitrate binding protein FerR (iron transport regulator)|nr:DUF4974 domain-containing protein [Chitinophagales bacterium]